MSTNINKCIFVGNLTKDSELSYSNSGSAICKFSMAINRAAKRDDKWVDEVSFLDFVLFGKRGESLNQYLLKGSSIAIECHAKQDRWEKDGQKRSRIVFVVDNIQLVGGKSNSENTQNRDNAQHEKFQQQPSVNNSKPFESSSTRSEDYIPF